METKICKKCGIEKEIDKFLIRKDSKDGHRGVCNECYKISRKLYKDTNRDMLLLKKKEYYEKNKTDILEIGKKYRKENKEIFNLKQRTRRRNKSMEIKDVIENKVCYKCEKEKQISSYNKCSDTRDGYMRFCRDCQRIENKKNRNKHPNYLKEKYKTDIFFRIKSNVRHRINSYIKTKKFLKKQQSFNLVGCSIYELKTYIENQFTDGMTWENYGQFGWHIDHKIPLNTSTTENEIYKLCHYTNLQPLWWRDNLTKK